MKSPKNPDQKSASKRREKVEPTWPLVLAVAVFLLGVYLVVNALSGGGQLIEEPIDQRQAELERQQKVEYYRRQLAEKLNRSRTISEYELVKESQQPSSTYHQESNYRQSVEGLPLDYETKTYSPREESKYAKNYLPDQRVAYDLQDDQNAEFWEEEARTKFLRQYLLNARAQGYELEIDTNYNVIVKRTPKKFAQNRMPQNALEASAEYKLEPPIQLRYRKPFFSPPPYCH